MGCGVHPSYEFLQLFRLASDPTVLFDLEEELYGKMLTFGAHRVFRGIGIQSFGNSGRSPRVLDLHIIAHLLFEVLKLTGNRCAGPRTINLDNHRYADPCISEFYVCSSLSHVEKYILKSI